MQISLKIDRLFKSLAAECQYQITEDEIAIYVEYLSRYGLEKVCEACLVLTETGEPRNVFPSVFEMERVILSLKKMETRSVPGSDLSHADQA